MLSDLKASALKQVWWHAAIIPAPREGGPQVLAQSGLHTKPYLKPKNKGKGEIRRGKIQNPKCLIRKGLESEVLSLRNLSTLKKTKKSSLYPSYRYLT